MSWKFDREITDFIYFLIQDRLIVSISFLFLLFSFFSIATDIVEERLHKAKQMGADVVVNGKTENLKDSGL